MNATPPHLGMMFGLAMSQSSVSCLSSSSPRYTARCTACVDCITDRSTDSSNDSTLTSDASGTPFIRAWGEGR